MAIKTSDSHFYVTIKPKQSLLGLAGIIGIFTGKKRVKENGEVEAEFLCINPRSNCSTIWATKEEIA